MANIAFQGRLTRDPEMKESAGGSFVRFSVADGSWFRPRSGETEPQSQYFECALWGPKGQAVFDYGRKGARVFVAGVLEPSNYTNKDGQEVKAQVVVATFCDLLETRAESEARASGQGDRQAPATNRNAGYSARPTQANRAPAPARQGSGYHSEEIPF